MIVSHKHRFIFLKTNKTAGTSVEIALSSICGDEDIITPISAEDEEKRKGLGYRGAQNYRVPFFNAPLRNLRLSMALDRRRHFFNHMQACDVKELVGDDVWNSYYKFCFERNPWDRMISFYYWRCRKTPDMTISQFLETDTPAVLLDRGRNIYTIDGEVVVDRICRFENLENDLGEVCDRLGIPRLSLPRAKGGVRRDKKHYSEILSPGERDKIATMFQREIELLGYEFDDKSAQG